MQPSNLPSWPPLGPTGPMPWCSSMEMPATCPPYRGSCECYDKGEYQQCLLWKDLPIGSLPTSGVRLPGGLPGGLNGCQVPVVMTLPELLSNGVTMLRGESTFLQVDLSQSATKEQESEALSLGGGLSHKPYQGHSCQSGRPNQHNHGGQQTPIPGSSGCFWASI